MAMTKKEQAILEQLRTEAALHWPTFERRSRCRQKGSSMMLYHLFCNRALFPKNQSHSCKISAENRPSWAGVGAILQNGRAC